MFNWQLKCTSDVSNYTTKVFFAWLYLIKSSFANVCIHRMHVRDHAPHILRALSWTSGTYFSDSVMPRCDWYCLKSCFSYCEQKYHTSEFCSISVNGMRNILVFLPDVCVTPIKCLNNARIFAKSVSILKTTFHIIFLFSLVITMYKGNIGKISTWSNMVNFETWVSRF